MSLRPREAHLALGQAGELKHPRPAAALDRLRRFAVGQQVGCINAVDRLGEGDADLAEIRGQSRRRVDRLHFWRDTLDRHRREAGIEQRVRAGAPLVEHDHRDRVFAIDQNLAQILQRIVAEAQRLRCRLGGGRAVPGLFNLDVVPRHLGPVDVGHKPVVHLGPQRHRGDRVRVGGVEFAPEKKRVVAAPHVVQLGAAGDLLAEENRRRGGLPFRVVMVRLEPGPVIRAGGGLFAAPQFPGCPVVKERHRLAKRDGEQQGQRQQPQARKTARGASPPECGHTGHVPGTYRRWRSFQCCNCTIAIMPGRA